MRGSYGRRLLRGGRRRSYFFLGGFLLGEWFVENIGKNHWANGMQKSDVRSDSQAILVLYPNPIPPLSEIHRHSDVSN